MLSYGLVLIKRLFVLALVTWLAWFTVFGFFPAVDSQLPSLVALLVTYGFLAYIGIPALLRVRHIIWRPTHLPTRTIARDGWAVDPINLVVLAKNERQFGWAMRKAGWLAADPVTPRTVIKMMIAFVFNRPYPTAPFGAYFVFGRQQDLSFQISTGNGSPRHRHHVRFWQVGTTKLAREHVHNNFWRKLLSRFLQPKTAVWVGAAIYDHGLSIRWRNLQLDHSVHGNTNDERDYLVATLKEAGVLKDTIGIKAGEPLRTRHQGLGEMIIADGYVTLCEIKRQFLPPASKIAKSR